MIALDRPNAKHILFDLDGTLLPMDMDKYIQIYFAGFCRRLPHLAPDLITGMLWEGIIAMMRNPGETTNREVFAQVFTRRTGMDYYACEDMFLQFYQTDYNNCAAACRPTPLAKELVRTLKDKGYTLTLATSPLYPMVATRARMQWAGLDEQDFAFITTFDAFHAAKPSIRFYSEVCEKLGVRPQDCLLIGNDAEEDGAAREIGMPVLLTTDCLINKKDLPLAYFEKGTLEEVLAWAQQL